MPPIIRLATEDDADQIQRIYAPFCADESHVSFEVEPPTSEEMGRRIAKREPPSTSAADATPRLVFRWARGSGARETILPRRPLATDCSDRASLAFTDRMRRPP